MLSDAMEEERIKEKVISAIMRDVRRNTEEERGHRNSTVICRREYLDGGEMKNRRVKKYCERCHRYVWSMPLSIFSILFGDDVGLITYSFWCALSVVIVFTILSFTVDSFFMVPCIFLFIPIIRCYCTEDFFAV